MTSPRELRLKLHLSQQELADLAGVHVTTIANWESGRVKPRDALRLALGAQRHVVESAALVNAVFGAKLQVLGLNLLGQTLNSQGQTMNIQGQTLNSHVSAPAPAVVIPSSPVTQGDPVSSVNTLATGRKGGAGGKPTREPLTDEQRSKLHTAYDKTLSHAEVEDIIEEALDHQAVKKRKSEYLYLRTWLRTETARIVTERERQERAKRPYAPAVNAEPEPPRKFFTSEEMLARHERDLAASQAQFAGLPHPFEVWKSA